MFNQVVPNEDHNRHENLNALGEESKREKLNG